MHVAFGKTQLLHTTLLRRLPVRCATVPGFRVAHFHSAVEGQARTDPTTTDGLEPERSVAPPLSFSSELCVYESSTDLAKLAKDTYPKCVFGAVLGLWGFAGVLAGVAATAPQAAQALVFFGSLANSYKHIVVSKRTLNSIAMRNVERISIMPTQAVTEDAAASAVAQEPSESVSVKERLDATPELELKVRTTNLDLRLKLSEPLPAWEGSKYSGLVDDERAAFRDVCKRADVLYIQDLSGWGRPGAPTSPDPELLTALLASSKVVSVQSVEARQDVQGLLSVCPKSVRQVEYMCAAATSAKQSGAPAADGEAKPVTPMEEMDAVGKSALIFNVIICLAGALFAGRLMAQDAEAAGVRKDPTLADLMSRLRGNSPSDK